MVTSNVWSGECLEEGGKNGNVKVKSLRNFYVERESKEST